MCEFVLLLALREQLWDMFLVPCFNELLSLHCDGIENSIPFRVDWASWNNGLILWCYWCFVHVLEWL